MRIRTLVGIISCAGILLASGLAGTPAGAGSKGTLCRMTYSLKGWSAFYKTAKGEGSITCDNGQSMKVKVKASGGGITSTRETRTVFCTVSSVITASP